MISDESAKKLVQIIKDDYGHTVSIKKAKKIGQCLVNLGSIVLNKKQSMKAIPDEQS